jgi:hypothetical protein
VCSGGRISVTRKGPVEVSDRAQLVGWERGYGLRFTCILKAICTAGVNLAKNDLSSHFHASTCSFSNCWLIFLRPPKTLRRLIGLNLRRLLNAGHKILFPHFQPAIDVMSIASLSLQMHFASITRLTVPGVPPLCLRSTRCDWIGLNQIRFVPLKTRSLHR